MLNFGELYIRIIEVLKRNKIRVGIFFGGPSREREVSFAGGRTVYDNLDKTRFEAVPIFVDSFGHFILLEWPYIYKGTIRDFFPIPSQHSDTSYTHYVESYYKGHEDAYEEEVGQIGKRLSLEDLPDHMDFAFLALHGSYGEDGTIQSLLTSVGIPYSGSGVLASAIGINKSVQKKLMDRGGFVMPKIHRIERAAWLANRPYHLKAIREIIPGKVVIRPAHQGSSIGVSILEGGDEEALTHAIDAAFFRKSISGKDWQALSEHDRKVWARSLPDVKENLGLPLLVNGHIMNTVEEVLDVLNNLAPDETALIEAIDSEEIVIAEEFISGREFSCIVIRDANGQVSALPPTEIVKKGHLYDYRSKYLPGFSRKETPISLDEVEVKRIMAECIHLFDYLEFNCYARIDGFYAPNRDIILNDPNTTSGMMPSSFFFHQAAEIGLNPSQFLTFIIHSSLVERSKSVAHFPGLVNVLSSLEGSLKEEEKGLLEKEEIAIIFGGYSYERHISVESGRNIFEKLASSSKYHPTPLFLMREGEELKLVEVPINLLLKDNADDIRTKIEEFKVHPLLDEIRSACTSITSTYARDSIFVPQEVKWSELKDRFASAFIALHGRPGEDGAVQRRLDALGLPYNGSSADVSSITINKFDTLQLLGASGFPVAEQMLVEGSDYNEDKDRWLDSIEGKFDYPLIAKPVDDGCSSAVMKIKDRQHLRAYLDALLRPMEELSPHRREQLGLAWNEEFPHKPEVLIEELVQANGAELFIEITCGLLSEVREGHVVTQVFEPSEAIASKDILSLEEKFLAGQGMNITPARLATPNNSYDHVASQVKADLKRAAEILGVTGYARIDAFVRVYSDGKVETVVIEVNSLPGMTPATCIYHQAAIEGMKPFDFIDKIMTFAHDSQQKKVEWV